MKTIASLLAATTGLSQAALVVADFNDMALGDMRNGQSSAQPSGTGTGFSSSHWNSGTSVVVTVAGDLTAPAATGYAITQSGTATSVSSLNNAADRQQVRPLSDPFIAGDSVWFSYLVSSTLATNRTGISLYETDSSGQSYNTGVNGRVLAIGSDLFVDGPESVLSGVFTLGETYLILGKLSVAGGTTTGNDAISIWINPDVSGGEAALGTASYSNADLDFLGGDTRITKLGLQVYDEDSSTNTAGRGFLDSVRLSDTGTGFTDVTGVVPEPSSAAMLLLGGLFLARRKRS